MDDFCPNVDEMYEDRVSGYVDWDFDCDFPYDDCPYGDNGDSSEQEDSE